MPISTVHSLKATAANSRRYAGALDGERGFTLIEMVVVCAVIGMVAAIALPQMLPLLVYSKVEGAARHLAGYGRAAIAHATVLRENIVIKVDLKNQEYTTVRLVEIEQNSHRLFDRKSSKDKTKSDEAEQADILDLMKREKPPSDAEMQAGADLMRERFSNYIQAQLKARSRMIKKDGILSDIGPLFDKPFKLDEESEEQSIQDPMLERTVLPAEVAIEAVKIGGELHTEGEVRIELSAVGLSEPVTFWLHNEDGDYFTVVWDPITGNVRLDRGKAAMEDANASMT